MGLSLTGVFLSAVDAVLPDRSRRWLEDFCFERQVDARIGGKEGSGLHRFWSRAANVFHRETDDWELREANIKSAALRAISVAGGAGNTAKLTAALKAEKHLDGILFRTPGYVSDNPAFQPVTNGEVIEYIKNHKPELLEDPYLAHLKNRNAPATSPQNAL